MAVDHIELRKVMSRRNVPPEMQERLLEEVRQGEREAENCEVAEEAMRACDLEREHLTLVVREATARGCLVTHCPRCAMRVAIIMVRLTAFAARAVFLAGRAECRKVAVDVIGKARVSTVALPTPEGLPVQFETMVFGGPLHGLCDRYATRAEAEKGHTAVCAMVRTVLAASSGKDADTPHT